MPPRSTWQPVYGITPVELPLGYRDRWEVAHDDAVSLDVAPPSLGAHVWGGQGTNVRHVVDASRLIDDHPDMPPMAPRLCAPRQLCSVPLDRRRLINGAWPSRPCQRCKAIVRRVIARGWPLPDPPCSGCTAPLSRCRPGWARGVKCCPDCDGHRLGGRA